MPEIRANSVFCGTGHECGNCDVGIMELFVQGITEGCYKSFAGVIDCLHGAGDQAGDGGYIQYAAAVSFYEVGQEKVG